MMAPCFSAAATSAGSGPISPSIEKTPSGDQKLAAGNIVEFGEDRFGTGRVFVPKDVDLGLRQPAAVDDAGVIEFVGDDVIFRRENRRDGACVGGKAGLKHDTGFHLFESRDPAFEFHVDVHGAGDGADGARSRHRTCGSSRRQPPRGADRWPNRDSYWTRDCMTSPTVEPGDRFAWGFQLAQGAGTFLRAATCPVVPIGKKADSHPQFTTRFSRWRLNRGQEAMALLAIWMRRVQQPRMVTVMSRRCAP